MATPVTASHQETQPHRAAGDPPTSAESTGAATWHAVERACAEEGSAFEFEAEEIELEAEEDDDAQVHD